MPTRLWCLALWVWLVRVFAPSGGANKAACSCPSSVQVCWGNLNLDKNLDKELGQILSRVFLLQSHLSKFPRRTWTRNLDNCWLPCYCLRGPRREGPPGIGPLLFLIPRQPEEENIRDSPPGEEPELGQILSRLAGPLVQVPPPNLDKELGQLQAALLLYTWSQPGIEASLHLPGIGAAPARRVIRIIRIIRSYGGGLALRVRIGASTLARHLCGSLHPAAPPARHRSIRCRAAFSILWPTQDCSTQSCGQRRIAPLNPAANAGLLRSILWPTQDCSTQSCGQRRIAPLNPVPNLLLGRRLSHWRKHM